MRGASAPLRGLLPQDYRAFKRGEAPLSFLPPLEQIMFRVLIISLFERGIKGVCMEGIRVLPKSHHGKSSTI